MARRRARPVRRSGFEDKVEQSLKDRGIKYEYESKTYKITVPVATRALVCEKCGHNKAVRNTRYTPDYYLPTQDITVEVKGRLTAENRRAYQAFVEQYPAVDFRMLLMRDNPITKGSKTKYSDWATSLGIKYSIGSEVPDEWL